MSLGAMIGAFAIASQAIASPSQARVAHADKLSGALLEIDQQVVYDWLPARIFLVLEQDVELNEVVDTNLLTLKQNVIGYLNDNDKLLDFTQFVHDPRESTRYEKAGYEPIIFINNARVPDTRVEKSITITHSEGQRSTATFTIKADNNVLDEVGAKVLIQLRNNNGIYTAFSGVVDVPELDLIYNKLTLNCVQLRDEILDKTNIANIGTYSTVLFGEKKDKKKELEDRLRTTTKVVDVDINGNAIVADYFPTGSHHTISDKDVYRRDPSISLISRAKLINKVNVTLKYTYTRQNVESAQFTIRGWSFCQVMRSMPRYTVVNNKVKPLHKVGQRKEFLNIATVNATIEGMTAWKLHGDISWTTIPDSGRFNCGRGEFYYASSRVASVDPQTKLATYIDYRKVYGTKAQWHAKARWTQNIIEEQTLTVQNTTSINKYSEVDKTENYSFTVQYTPKDDDYYNTASDIVGSVGNYDTAMRTAYEIGKTTILKSHRANILSFEQNLDPKYSVHETITSNMTKIKGKFKIVNVTHNIDVTTGEASTSIQAAGSEGASASDTPLTYNIMGVPFQDYLNRKYSIDLRRDSFIMPDIPREATAPKTIKRNNTYEVNIPSSGLRIITT